MAVIYTGYLYSKKIMSHTNFRPPLTAEELREIGQRRDSRDIIPLLWEIKRLRALILRADQITRTNTSSLFLIEVFKKELECEPAIVEDEARRRAFAMSNQTSQADRS